MYMLTSVTNFVTFFASIDLGEHFALGPSLFLYCLLHTLHHRQCCARLPCFSSSHNLLRSSYDLFLGFLDSATDSYDSKHDRHVDWL